MRYKLMRVKTSGFNVVWSNVNQAWFVMFGDSVLRIFNEKADAVAFVEDCK